MVYSINDIENLIEPVMLKYGINAAWLFGSYARGEATESSDVDLIVDTSGSGLKSLGELALLFEDLEKALQKKIDLVTLDSMSQPTKKRSQISFRQSVNSEKVELYAAA